MKKILMGLLAMSAVSFAVAPTITGEAQDNTNYFNRVGELIIRGRFTSKEPDAVKYVIFASSNGDWGDAESELILPVYGVGVNVANGQPDSNAGYREAISKKIYVKRVVNDTVASLEDEKVVFEFVFQGDTANSAYITLGSTNYLQPGLTRSITAFFTTAKLQEIASATGLEVLSSRYLGKYKSGGGVEGIGIKGIKFTVETMGVLEIGNGDGTTTSPSSGNIITDRDILTKWNTYFSKTPIEGQTVIRATIE